MPMPRSLPDRWRALSPYLDHALDVPGDDRAAWLDSIADRDPDLAGHLRTLLDSHDRAGRDGFLDGTAF
mgnify:CR=1 FL=1